MSELGAASPSLSSSASLTASPDSLPLISSVPHSPGNPNGNSSHIEDEQPGAPVKKRKSRWQQAADDAAAAAAAAAASASTSTPSPSTSSSDQPRVKKSRWGDPTPSTSLTPASTAAQIAAAMSAALFSPSQLEHFKLQSRIDLLTSYLANPSLYLPTEPRSPSPEPIYDPHGQRTNTREQRYKSKWSNERNELILSLTAVNPSYRPPADWKKQTKFERKCYIPIKEHPNYNFIGLIIGPRGSTQKKMEKETGCKIVIRGRGSSKDGRGMKKQPDESDNDEIHVLITGDSQEKVDETAKIVEKLLIPIDEALNEHKTRQLRELALINGTLRDDVQCRICGGKGHKLHECPERVGERWKPADVKCDFCGEMSHVSADCPKKGRAEKGGEELDVEYANFMNEITGGQISQKAIQGMLGGGEKAAGEEKDGGAQRAIGGGSQLLLTDGNERPRNPNVQRVGDGIVRRIISQDPRENAREYRPLNQPPPVGDSQADRPQGPPQRLPPLPGYPYAPPYQPYYPPHYAPYPYPPHASYGPPPAGYPPYAAPPPPVPSPSAQSAVPPPVAPALSPYGGVSGSAPAVSPASSAPPPLRPPGLNKFACWPPPEHAAS